MESIAAADIHDAEWHYELEGTRQGPVSEKQILAMIADKRLHRASYVWKKGLTDWTTIESTAFGKLFADTPPPLSGAAVNNTLVWWLAAAPLAGLFLESFLSGATGKDIDNFWWVTLVLNVLLSMLDEKKLQQAGHDTARMGQSWLVPVYLYKRAEVLKQKNTYFIVWVVLFCVCLLAEV